MQRSSGVDIECAVALGKAYKAMRGPQPNEMNDMVDRSGSSKYSVVGMKDKKILQSVKSNEHRNLHQVTNQVDTAQPPYFPTHMPMNTCEQQTAGCSVTPPSKESTGRPKFDHSGDSWKPHPTINEMVSLIWQLKRLLLDILMKEDGCFSQTWIQSASQLQSICEKFFLTSLPSFMTTAGASSIPEELNCTAAILEFIRGVNGNDCGLLMHQYSIMTRRVAQCILHLATAEIVRRKTPGCYRDVIKRQCHFPLVATYGHCAYQPAPIGIIGPHDFRWVYPDVNRHGIVSGGPYAPTATHFQTPTYPSTMVPISPVYIPQYQPYAYPMGSANGYVQDVGQRQDMPRMDEQFNAPMAEMGQNQMENMCQYVPVQENNQAAYAPVEEPSSSTMASTRSRDRPFFVGPWDVYREELTPEGIYPAGWTNATGTSSSTARKE
ncbi:uncharacterized protein BXIN_1873 [Babesia sp. Xinjiang]|uniref:uncharacterized protein n=1 Tax=Babesia sp. Xinjiang TaxID=462227 RepID=UPI000A262288|nr:uncharacterized protein BXIN_1873 [Babesia sp. Xinjiang]ORM40368.1 hypothetical protein BXIN_1873 [Babesia sp. Xinjiang]